MKASKKLGTVITVLQFVGLAAFLVSMHTIFVVLDTTLPNSQREISTQMGDPVIIPFTLHPRNDGLLEAKLTISLSIGVDKNEVLATDTVAVTLPPGGATPVDLELRVPLDQFQGSISDNTQVTWLVDVEVTTLFGLISFRDTMTVTGGA